MRVQVTESSGTTTATEIQEKLDTVRAQLQDNKRTRENLQAYCDRLSRVISQGSSVIEGSPDQQAENFTESLSGTLAGKLEKALLEGPLSTVYRIGQTDDGTGTSLGEAYPYQPVAQLADNRPGPTYDDGHTQVVVDRVLQEIEPKVTAIERLNARLNQARYRQEQCRQKLDALANQQDTLETLQAELNQQISTASADEPNPQLQACSPNIEEDTDTQAAEEAQEAQEEEANTTVVAEKAAQGASTSPADAFLTSPIDQAAFRRDLFAKSYTDGRRDFLIENFTGSATASGLPAFNTFVLPIANGNRTKLTKDHLIYIAQVMKTGTLAAIPNYGTNLSYKAAAEQQVLLYMRPNRGRNNRPNGYLAPDFIEVLLQTLERVRNFEFFDQTQNRTVQPYSRLMYRGTEAFPPTVLHSGSPRFPDPASESRDAGVFQFTSGHMNGYAIDVTLDTFDISGRVFDVRRAVPRAYRSNWKAYIDRLELVIERESGGILEVFNEYKYKTPDTTGAHLHIEMKRKFWKHNKGIFAVTNNQLRYQEALRQKRELAAAPSANDYLRAS